VLLSLTPGFSPVGLQREVVELFEQLSWDRAIKPLKRLIAHAKEHLAEARC